MTNLSQHPSCPGVAQEAGRSAAVLPIVCTAIALASLDLFVVDVALPNIGADLGDADLSELSWLISGYAITVGLLTAVLVQGESWGWTTGRTGATVAVGLAAGGAFILRCLRRDNPLIDPGLFRVRSFRGAPIVVTVFTAAFGAMLLSIILWCQQVWGWSALSTGLAVAPGPLMVPLFSFLVLGRLIARTSTATVTVVGAGVFASGTAWWATLVDLEAEYVAAVLPGMLLTGAGVGLTLPTLMGAATASLPPAALATGSAVVNMVRQVGLAVGVAGLVAVIGLPDGPAAALGAFQRGWIATTAAGALTGLLAWMLLAERPGVAPDLVPAVPGGAP